MMVTLIAIDGRILASCAPAERCIAWIASVGALLNGGLIASSLALALIRHEEPIVISLPIGLIGGLWFLGLQRLLLLLHGERRDRTFQIFSRFFCVCFLGFFAFLAGCSIHQELSFLSLGSIKVSDATLFPTIAATFLFPLYARMTLMNRGEYQSRYSHAVEKGLEKWDRLFRERYESFVRIELGISEYRMPSNMLAAERLKRSRTAL